MLLGVQTQKNGTRSSSVTRKQTVQVAIQYKSKTEMKSIKGLPKECRSLSQYTDTIASQQKGQRTHKKQIPMPGTQQQQLPKQTHKTSENATPRELKIQKC